MAPGNAVFTSIRRANGEEMQVKYTRVSACAGTRGNLVREGADMEPSSLEDGRL